MRLLFILLAHLLVTLARLARPGGIRAVAAESLAIKHQLLIMKRGQRRSPNLTSWDRVILGFCTLLVSPRGLGKTAVILKTSTLLNLHRALVKRKYRLLYTPRRRGRPGPRGPSRELIDAVVRDETAQPILRLPLDRRANLECLRRRAQQECRPAHPSPLVLTGT